MIKKLCEYRKKIRLSIQHVVGTGRIANIGMFLIMAMVITAGLDTPVRNAEAVCDPQISGDWDAVYGVLLNRMIKNQLVAQAKSILAKELNLEYSVGSMMTSMSSDLTNGAVTGSDLNNALDFDTTTITPVLNEAVAKEKQYINDNIKFSRFKDELNLDLRNFIKNILWGYLKLNNEPNRMETLKHGAWVVRKGVYEEFIQTYTTLLESAVITNIYKPYIKSLYDAMYAQMDLNAGYCAEMANLGSKQDINDHINSTNKHNAKQSIVECDKEAIKGINVVIDTSGEALKIIMDFTEDEDGITFGFKGKHGNELLELLRDTFIAIVINNPQYASINNAYKCDGDSGDFNHNGGGQCRNMVNLTNTEAVTYTNKFVSDVQADILSLSAAGDVKLMTKLLTKIDQSKQTVATVVEAEKGVDIKVQGEWKSKLAGIMAGPLGEATNWKNVVAGDVKLSDTKNVAALIAGIGTPDRHTKDSVQSFVVAEEAISVANNIKERLKGINPAAIDGGLDDQAWKDHARLTYYNLVLENELLKLKAVDVMTYAGKHGGAGVVAEINR